MEFELRSWWLIRPLWKEKEGHSETGIYIRPSALQIPTLQWHITQMTRKNLVGGGGGGVISDKKITGNDKPTFSSASWCSGRRFVMWRKRDHVIIMSCGSRCFQTTPWWQMDPHAPNSNSPDTPRTNKYKKQIQTLTLKRPCHWLHNLRHFTSCVVLSQR